MSTKTQGNTRCYEVTMRVYADEDAVKSDVEALIHDLEWTGGCNEPSDPRFYCLDVKNLRVRRARAFDRKAKS